jgi:hypothetical protein
MGTSRGALAQCNAAKVQGRRAQLRRRAARSLHVQARSVLPKLVGGLGHCGRSKEAAGKREQRENQGREGSKAHEQIQFEDKKKPDESAAESALSGVATANFWARAPPLPPRSCPQKSSPARPARPLAHQLIERQSSFAATTVLCRRQPFYVGSPAAFSAPKQPLSPNHLALKLLARKAPCFQTTWRQSPCAKQGADQGRAWRGAWLVRNLQTKFGHKIWPQQRKRLGRGGGGGADFEHKRRCCKTPVCPLQVVVASLGPRYG